MTDQFDDDGLGPFRGLITAAAPCAVFWICLALVVLSLVGCGGGDAGDAEPGYVVTSEYKVRGGDDFDGRALVAAQFIGPPVAASASGLVDVDVSIRWGQSITTEAVLLMSLTSGGADQDPAPYVVIGSVPAGRASVSFGTKWRGAIAQGHKPVATVRLKATDADGFPIRVLGSFESTAAWTVREVRP